MSKSNYINFDSLLNVIFCMLLYTNISYFIWSDTSQTYKGVGWGGVVDKVLNAHVISMLWPH